MVAERVAHVLFAGRSADNRWNEQGSPTLYLAGDEGVLIAEWGRHFTLQRAPALQQFSVERSVYRLELSLDQVLDVRSNAVGAELSLPNAPRGGNALWSAALGVDALLTPVAVVAARPCRRGLGCRGRGCSVAASRCRRPG